MPKSKRPPRQPKRNVMAGVHHTPEERFRIGQAICDRIADGQLVSRACSAEGIDARTLRRWLIVDEPLRPLYAQAMEANADHLAEQVEVISAGEDTFGVLMEHAARLKLEELEPERYAAALKALESARVQRDRLRVDTFKWLAAKRRPRYYGEKLDLTSGGEQLAPAVVLMPALDAVPLPSAGDTMIGADAIDQRPPATRPDLKALLGKRA